MNCDLGLQNSRVSNTLKINIDISRIATYDSGIRVLVIH